MGAKVHPATVPLYHTVLDFLFIADPEISEIIIACITSELQFMEVTQEISCFRLLFGNQVT